MQYPPKDVNISPYMQRYCKARKTSLGLMRGRDLFGTYASLPSPGVHPLIYRSQTLPHSPQGTADFNVDTAIWLLEYVS